MVEALKGQLRKLALQTYFLLVFALTLFVLNWASPWLKQVAGPKALGREVGNLVAAETIGTTTLFLSLGLVLFAVWAFIFLRRLFKGLQKMEVLLEQGAKRAQALGLSLNQKAQDLSQKARELQGCQEVQSQKWQSLLQERESKRNQIQQQWDLLTTLLKEMKGLQDHFLSATATEPRTAEHDPSLGPLAERENHDPHGEWEKMMDSLQDILFKSQILAFNTSVEVGRGPESEDAEAGLSLLPLTQQLEKLLLKGEKLSSGLREQWEKEREDSQNLLQASQREKGLSEERLRQFTELYHQVFQMAEGMRKSMEQMRDEQQALEESLESSLQRRDDEAPMFEVSMRELAQDLEEIGRELVRGVEDAPLGIRGEPAGKTLTLPLPKDLPVYLRESGDSMGDQKNSHLPNRDLGPSLAH